MNRAAGTSPLSGQPVEQALVRKRITEQLALDVHYHGGSWPPVVTAAQEALQTATAAFGPSSECIVPFLEQAGAAAAGASDLQTAETQYRRALALLPERSASMFYRATLTANLARLLSRGDQREAAAQTEAEGDRIRDVAQAGDVFEDIYRVMQSWVGPTLLEPVFLGPTTGAQVLDDMAARIGIDGEPFGFQLNELHAQNALSGLSDVPDRLQDTLEHNRLDALLSFALAQDNRTALAHIAGLEESLIARMATQEPRLDLDRERLGLIGALKAEGRLGETQEVMAAIAPESLAADKDLALAIYATRADLMLAAGDTEGARPVLEMAEAQLAPPPLPQLEKKDLFVAEHAVGDLLAHDADGAVRRLTPFAEKDSFGAQHQSQVLRLLADIARRQGRNADAIQAMQHAMTVTENTTRQLNEGPLSFGADQNTRDLTQSVDQAVTLALAAPGDASLSKFAAEAVLRARGHQLALSAARLRELRLLPLGTEPTMRALSVVRTRLALELRNLGSDPNARPRWPVLDAVLGKEDDLQRHFSSQSLGIRPRPAQPDLPAILANLGERSAMIIYVAYRHFDPLADALNLGRASDPRMAAALLERDRPVRWADLGPLAVVDEIQVNLRKALSPFQDPISAQNAPRDIVLPDAREVARAEETAARLVFGPWRADLAGMRRVVFAPDGSLNVVPFAALLATAPDRDGPAVSVVASADDIAASGEMPAGPPVIFAGPDFNAESVTPLPDLDGLPPAHLQRVDATYPALPGAAAELGKIQRMFPGAAAFTGAAANKAALMAVHRPEILHIATHADFRPPLNDVPSSTQLLSAAGNPMLTSSLIFAGANTRTIGEAAIASALELSTLDLDGTQLVVLSACETGLGGVSAGEGVFGLRRAFAEAGARRLVVSLWKVDDDATAFLMGMFYQALKDGLDVDAALAHAQGETRRQPRWAHPFYWASFILSGAHDRFAMASASMPSANITVPDGNQPLKGKVLWTYHTGGGIQGAPAIDGQMVFAGSEDGAIYALNRPDGSRLWRFSTASKIYGQAQIAGGRLFFGDHDGSVYALDETSGRQIWQRKVSGAIDGSLAVDNGVVYVPADRLSALDASSGEVLWTYDPAAGQPPAPPGSFIFRQFGARPSLDPEFIYIGDMAGRFYKLRRGDGQPGWVVTLGAGIVSEAILEGNHVIVGTWGGSIVALDRTTGAQAWRYESHSEIDQQILSTRGLIVFGTHDTAMLTALDAHTGTLAWTISLETGAVWSLAAAGQQLLIGSLNGLALVDLADGERRRLLDAKVTGTSVILAGTAYVGDAGGTLYAIQ